MKRPTRARLGAMLLATVVMTLLPGCRRREEPISVYLWSSELYGTYAEYIQSQLPDMEIQFVVGNNDLDFYKFLSENGGLPDIITCRRFSLNDSALWKDSLMDLSMTEEAGAVYETYLSSFTDSEDTINWLPVCGMVDGIVANRGLFARYGIDLPTDYESFVSACRAFEAVGIRGYEADFACDDTCLELLQGWSIPELTSLEGQSWRLRYEDPQDEMTGLDMVIWPEVFRRMERFLRDAKVQPEDITLDYGTYRERFLSGQTAMIRNTGAFVVRCNNTGMDTALLPYFGEDGEAWLMTYPSFQVALSRELEQDKARQARAMEVLGVMLSEGGQNALAAGEDVISYSQTVELTLDPALENLKPCIRQNHLFIRLASNAFYAVSKDVVTKMILGEYDAQQAYEVFDAQLRGYRPDDGEPVLSLEQDYSNGFCRRGGSKAASVMAASVRRAYGAEVLIAPAYSFTGSLRKAAYSEKMAGDMVMPNALMSYHGELTGAQLKRVLKLYVEGVEGGFTPFNPGALPAVSGIAIDVAETDTGFSLTGVRINGREIDDGEIYRLTCLDTQKNMAKFPEDVTRSFRRGDTGVRAAWLAYLESGGRLAQPEDYLILR